MTQSHSNVNKTLLTMAGAVLALAFLVAGPALGQQNDQAGMEQAKTPKQDKAQDKNQNPDMTKAMSKVKVKNSTPKQAVKSLHQAISQGDAEAAKSLVDTSDEHGQQQAQYIGLLASLRGNARKARKAATRKYGEKVVKKKMKMQDLARMNPLSSASENWDQLKIDEQGDQAIVHVPANSRRGQQGKAQKNAPQAKNKSDNQDQSGDKAMAQQQTKPLKLVKKDGKWMLSSLPDVGKTPGGLQFAVKLLGATNELMTEAPSVIDQQDTYKAFETQMEQRAQKKMQPLMQQMMKKAMQKRQQMQPQQGAGADQGQSPGQGQGQNQNQDQGQDQGGNSQNQNSDTGQNDTGMGN